MFFLVFVVVFYLFAPAVLAVLALLVLWGLVSSYMEQCRERERKRKSDAYIKSMNSVYSAKWSTQRMRDLEAKARSKQPHP